MTIDELRNALDGMFAYDTGSRDSGIHDHQLKDRAIEAFGALTRPEIARLLRDMFLSEEAIAQGYGGEDLREFLRWLDDEFGDDLSRSA